MKNKVLIIGIDGGTFDVINKLVKQDKLKNIKKVMESGLSNNLISTLPPITAAAWTSFFTGLNPANHGVFEFYYPDPKTKKIHSSFNKCHDNTIWKILTDVGLKSVVINVPGTYPASELNGVMVSGLPGKNANNIAYPPDIFEKLNIDKNEYKILPETGFYKYGEDYAKLMTELSNMVDIRLKLTTKLIKEDWDLFIVHFFATDWAQHLLWKYYDKDSPFYEKNEELEKHIPYIYEKIDNAIGKIISNINIKDTNIFIVSDHGFGANNKTIYINNWLEQKGLLKKRNLSSSDLFYYIFERMDKLIGFNMTSKLIEKGHNIIDEIISKFDNRFDELCIRLIEKTPKLQGWSKLKSLNLFRIIDWDKTIAYSVGTSGLIYLNDEVIAKDSKLNKNDIKNYITRELENLKNDSDENLIDKVYETKKYYNSKNNKIAPSLIPMCNSKPCYFNPRMLTDTIFSDPDEIRTGNHKMEGVFIACGNNIKNNLRNNFESNIWDIMPTVLYLFGYDISSQVDGRILPIFKDEFSVQNDLSENNLVEEGKIKNSINKIF